MENKPLPIDKQGQELHQNSFSSESMQGEKKSRKYLTLEVKAH